MYIYHMIIINIFTKGTHYIYNIYNMHWTFEYKILLHVYSDYILIDNNLNTIRHFVTIKTTSP